MKKCNLYFDGACTPVNPDGDMGIGFSIIENGKEVYDLSHYIPKEEWKTTTSNNLAEYLALLQGLKRAYTDGYEEINVYGDSMLVIKQMSGLWKIKNGSYVPIANKVKDFVKLFNKINFTHIPREENNRADELSKRDIPHHILEEGERRFQYYKSKKK